MTRKKGESEIYLTARPFGITKQKKTETRKKGISFLFPFQSDSTQNQVMSFKKCLSLLCRSPERRENETPRFERDRLMCLIHAWGVVLISPCCAPDESKDICWRLISSSSRENSNGDAVRASWIASKHEMVIISVRRKYDRRSCEHNSSSAHGWERTEQDDQCIRRRVWISSCLSDHHYSTPLMNSMNTFVSRFIRWKDDEEEYNHLTHRITVTWSHSSFISF